MTSVSAEYSKWATADQQCERFAAFTEDLKERRAEAVRDAWHDPAIATEIVARLDSEIAAAVPVKRALWIRRTDAYQAHKAHLAAGREAAAHRRAARKAAEAAMVAGGNL